MTPTDTLRELAWPATDQGALFALLGFFALGKLVLAAGLLGIWLLVVTLPALFRYLLALLEARAAGREAPVPGIELFNWVENFWSLLPLPVAGLVAWGEWLLVSSGRPGAALAGAVAALALLPAAMAVLALTHDAADALNPAAWLRFMRSAGPRYLLAPAGALAVGLLAHLLSASGLPAAVGEFAWLYALFVGFSLTGAVARDAGPAAAAGEGHGKAAEPGSRGAVLNHAYGLISRGNLAGGLDHLQQYLAAATDAAADGRWLFEQMLAWERADAALYFGQRYLAMLLAGGHDVDAVKLISRCLLVDPRFRPAAADRAAVERLLERLQRDDIARQLAD